MPPLVRLELDLQTAKVLYDILTQVQGVGPAYARAVAVQSLLQAEVPTPNEPQAQMFTTADSTGVLSVCFLRDVALPPMFIHAEIIPA